MNSNYKIIIIKIISRNYINDINTNIADIIRNIAYKFQYYKLNF